MLTFCINSMLSTGQGQYFSLGHKWCPDDICHCYKCPDGFSFYEGYQCLKCADPSQSLWQSKDHHGIYHEQCYNTCENGTSLRQGVAKLISCPTGSFLHRHNGIWQCFDCPAGTEAVVTVGGLPVCKGAQMSRCVACTEGQDMRCLYNQDNFLGYSRECLCYERPSADARLFEVEDWQCCPQGGGQCSAATRHGIDIQPPDVSGTCDSDQPNVCLQGDPYWLNGSCSCYKLCKDNSKVVQNYASVYYSSDVWNGYQTELQNFSCEMCANGSRVQLNSEYGCYSCASSQDNQRTFRSIKAFSCPAGAYPDDDYRLGPVCRMWSACCAPGMTCADGFESAPRYSVNVPCHKCHHFTDSP